MNARHLPWVLVLSLWSCQAKEATKPPEPASAPAPSTPVAAAPPVAEAPSPSLPVPANAELSDVLKVPRPEKGEYLGLYLKGNKIGFLFTHISLSPDRQTVRSVSDVNMKAKVGANAISQRQMKETRVYESKPGGRLLSFVMEQHGDGGDQTLEGTALPTGVRVVIKRAGGASEVKMLPPSKEVVEDVDQARVALFRNATVKGTVTDSMDLEQYGVTTTVGSVETRTAGGVAVKLRNVTTLSEKEKVPAQVWLDEQGRTIEVQYGPMMTGYFEPEDKARRIDVVEVFALTRVQLPKDAPQGPTFTMVLKGVDPKFWTESYRQKWKPLPDKTVQVQVVAEAPKKTLPRPLADPSGGANLKATIQVESQAPAIVALAQQIVGDEKDAYTAAKKINDWVYRHLVKDYGVSADSATGVLSQMKGDCTEHSLLTVSLLRAAGIPAKRIDGLVYLKNDDGVPALYWHEWVEAFVGEWTQMDPTFGQAVANATRLAVGEESSAEITPLIGAMTVLEVK